MQLSTRRKKRIISIGQELKFIQICKYINVKFPLKTKTVFKKALLFLSVILLAEKTYAQEADSLMAALEKENEPKTQYTTATFKGTRIINGQSIELPAKGVLQFMINHRFGTINSGAYNFFGLDEAAIRLGLDYGITPSFTAGIGRSSLGKVYDGYLKYRLLRQAKGEKAFPFTLVLYSSAGISTIEQSTPDRDIRFIDRLTYIHQALFARKFSDRLSLQLAPVYIHRNVVPAKEFQNDVLAVGIGGRFRLSRRISVNSEYYYLLPGHTADNFYNSFAIGFDIETGGHVFQLHLTNSRGMIEQQFVPQTTDNFLGGDIHFGFNISRVFNVCTKDKGKSKEW
jgi:hypothetical protein